MESLSFWLTGCRAIGWPEALCCLESFQSYRVIYHCFIVKHALRAVVSRAWVAKSWRLKSCFPWGFVEVQCIVFVFHNRVLVVVRPRYSRNLAELKLTDLHGPLLSGESALLLAKPGAILKLSLSNGTAVHLRSWRHISAFIQDATFTLITSHGHALHSFAFSNNILGVFKVLRWLVTTWSRHIIFR